MDSFGYILPGYYILYMREWTPEQYEENQFRYSYRSGRLTGILYHIHAIVLVPIVRASLCTLLSSIIINCTVQGLTKHRTDGGDR